MSSRDYYHSASRPSRRSDGDEVKREERLPSLRHVVGDVYESRTSSAYDFHDVKRSLPNVSNDPYLNHSTYDKHGYSQRGPTLAPIYSGTSQGHGTYPAFPSSHSSTPRHASHVETQPVPSSRPRTNADYPSSQDHAYGAFYSSRNGDLVPVTTSSRPVGMIRRSDIPDEDDDPKKKYKCPECGKGFDRPSGLETHQSKHTGDRAYPCTVRGCNKTFTVRSNMTRHVRTQHQGAPEDPYHSDDRGSPRYSTYSGTSRGSSNNSTTPSAAYYSSGRRS